MNIGDRVGAILSYGQDGVCSFLGYGVYEGETIPTDASIRFFGISLNQFNYPNPTILLDNGKRVYGCECWWASEAKVKTMLVDAKVVKEINIDDVRKELSGIN